MGMGRRVTWRSTRIDLFRDEGKFRVARIARSRGGGEQASEEEVTPEAFVGEREGGFSQAFVVAREVSGAGEMAQVRIFERDRWLRRRMVNTYRVDLTRRERER